MALSFVVFPPFPFLKSRPFLSPRKDVISVRSKDAWGHLFYLIITLPALLHRSALSLLCHLKCLAGLFSETIMKLCANTPPTAPPPSVLQPRVQEPERRFLHCCSVNGKTNRAPSIGPHLHPAWIHTFIKVLIQSVSNTTDKKYVTYFFPQKKKSVCNEIHCTDQAGAAPRRSLIQQIPLDFWG